VETHPATGYRMQEGVGEQCMKVLVACEFSGTVREAFRAKGHEAYSVDVIDSLPFSYNHVKADVLDCLDQNWDLMIAHPPCTDLCVSGARWFGYKIREQDDGIEFVRKLMDAPIPKICIENPIGVISNRIRKPDQIIQPWQFGHGETKSTCLWLKGLPKLMPTHVVEGRQQKMWAMPPSEDRGKLRSITYQGIAEAMAEQWSKPVTLENYF